MDMCAPTAGRGPAPTVSSDTSPAMPHKPAASRGMSAWFKWGIALGLFFAVFAVLDHFGPKVCSDVILSTHLRPPQFWIFDPKVLHSVAKEALARKTPVNETMLYIQRALAKKYPGHVVEDQEWMYNIAGALRVQERAKNADARGYRRCYGWHDDPARFHHRVSHLLRHHRGHRGPHRTHSPTLTLAMPFRCLSDGSIGSSPCGRLLHHYRR